MHNVDVERLRETAEKAEADPAAARMSVHLEGGWHTEPREAQFGGEVPYPKGAVTFTADFPDFLGGEGRAPAPLAYCFYGAMCCYGATFATQAAMAGVQLKSMSITLDLDVDFRTALGMGDFDPLGEFRFRVVVGTTASDEEVAEVKRLTDERCPAIWAMNNPVPHSVAVERVT